MTLPNKILLTDLLNHRVICDQGIDHGNGILCWMHPPVHRLLGRASSPSSLRLNRHIWRLDQLRGLGKKQVYVKGDSEETDQVMLERLPTLMQADLLSKNGERIGTIVDMTFDPLSGKINHYLIARSDPRIPGTSRWRLTIDRILDQQPGMVSADLTSLDQLPLAKSSIRQSLLSKSKILGNQIKDITDQASNKLEGWLDELPSNTDSIYDNNEDPIENWNSGNFNSDDQTYNEEDPWV